MFAPLIFLRSLRVSILPLLARPADACSATQTSRLSLRENSRKSERGAMYAKWCGRPWRKPKLSNKFSCDAGRATKSRGSQRGPGVTFEHVDYNCDLCRRFRPFHSLFLSAIYLVLSCSKARSCARFIPSHSFLTPPLIRSFVSSASSLLYQRLRRRRSMIECALGCYYTAYCRTSRSTRGRWGLTRFERKIERSLKSESKQLPYRPAIRTQYQLNKSTLHKFA